MNKSKQNMKNIFYKAAILVKEAACRKIAATLLLAFFTTVGVNTGYAQTATIDKAKITLKQIMNYQGDSVHVQLSDIAKSAITPLQLNTLWYSFKMQFGDFIEDTDWKENHTMGYDMATCKLIFKNSALNFIVAYRGNTIESLLFKPEEKKVETAAVSNDKFTEEKMTLKCDGYEMPAILTIPENTDNPPCVIIVHGSGPSDMDGSTGKTKIYRDIAHKLAERGIAVFRYDKRTYVYKDIPDSIADRINVDYETTNDALAAVKMMKEYKDVDNENIFIIGHSQGGMMIPRIANRTNDVRGYIMLSAPAQGLLDAVQEQMEYLYSISMNPTWPEIKPELEKQINNFKNYGTDSYDTNIPTPMNLPISYLKDIESYNQIEEAQKIHCPLLILNGEADYQVTMKDFKAWENALKLKSNVQYKSYSGLSHLYTPSSNPPSPADYNKEAEFSDKVIEDICTWITENLRK